MSSIGLASRPGSVNYEREGGIICCNFNPVHNPSLETKIILLPFLWLFLPPHFLCGMCGPVVINGLTFYVVDGAVQCRANVKHCCSEDPAIFFFDVQDIRHAEYQGLRTTNYGALGIYGVQWTFEILYRNEADQLVLYKTCVLLSGSDPAPFVNVLRRYIQDHRRKASTTVTFGMLGSVRPQHWYHRPEPQQITVEGFMAANPHLFAGPGSAPIALSKNASAPLASVAPTAFAMAYKPEHDVQKGAYTATAIIPIALEVGPGSGYEICPGSDNEVRPELGYKMY